MLAFVADNRFVILALTVTEFVETMHPDKLMLVPVIRPVVVSEGTLRPFVTVKPVVIMLLALIRLLTAIFDTVTHPVELIFVAVKLATVAHAVTLMLLVVKRLLIVKLLKVKPLATVNPVVTMLLAVIKFDTLMLLIIANGVTRHVVTLMLLVVMDGMLRLVTVRFVTVRLVAVAFVEVAFVKRTFDPTTFATVKQPVTFTFDPFNNPVTVNEGTVSAFVIVKPVVFMRLAVSTFEIVTMFAVKVFDDPELIVKIPVTHPLVTNRLVVVIFDESKHPVTFALTVVTFPAAVTFKAPTLAVTLTFPPTVISPVDVKLLTVRFVRLAFVPVSVFVTTLHDVKFVVIKLEAVTRFVMLILLVFIKLVTLRLVAVARKVKVPLAELTLFAMTLVVDILLIDSVLVVIDGADIETLAVR